MMIPIVVLVTGLSCLAIAHDVNQENVNARTIDSDNKRRGRRTGQRWFGRNSDESEFPLGFLDETGNREIMMSMSMSFSYIPTTSMPKTPMPTPPAAPSFPPLAPEEEIIPTTTVKSTPSSAPSNCPSGSSFPSILPTTSGLETTVPLPLVDDNIGTYECIHGVIKQVDTETGSKTAVDLRVTYVAEVRGTAISSQTLSTLESSLLRAAIGAALSCDDPDRRSLEELHSPLEVMTSKIGSCDTTFPQASCFVLETKLDFLLGQQMNSDYAEYLSYVAIQNGMVDNIFIVENADLLQLTYVAPLPLVVPMSDSQPLDDASTQNDLKQERNDQVPRWIIGTSVAVIAGGLVGIGAWLYKKHGSVKPEVNKQDAAVAQDSVSESAASDDSLLSSDHDISDETDVEWQNPRGQASLK